MSSSARVRRSFIIGGENFVQNKTLSAEAQQGRSVDVPAAKTGTLTTRTDDDTGSLTMEASHGITTGATLDLYWSGGSRRGLTVGTVSGTTVPIDGGAGDVLPSAAAAITAMVPVSEAMSVSGTNIAAIAFSHNGTEPATFKLAGGDDVEDWAQVVPVAGVGGWHEEMPEDNPVTGDTITQVLMSHGDSTKTVRMRYGVLHD